MRHADGGDDDHRRQDVGQDLAQHDVAARGAERARRLDIFEFARDQRLAPHDAARDHPFLVGEREDDVDEARAHHRHQPDGEDEVGEAEQDIDDARDDDVDPAAQVPRREPGEDADVVATRMTAAPMKIEMRVP
jgi:hypothetical protein